MLASMNNTYCVFYAFVELNKTHNNTINKHEKQESIYFRLQILFACLISAFHVVFIHKN